MKKSLFFVATLLAAGFVSCTNETGNEVTPPVEQDRVPVFLSISGNNATVTTRGTGAVGDIEGNESNWHGEKLNIYMFDKNAETLELAEDPTTGDYVFNNVEITTPDGAASGYANYGEPKYYPMVGNFDFFAYRADDAATISAEGTAALPAPDAEKKQYILPVTIDGSQDLMVSKADMSDIQRAAFKAAVGDEKADRYYSAFSARKKIGYDGNTSEYGVQPHFKFEHLLSRLVFSVKPSKKDVSDASVAVDDVDPSINHYLGVNIDSIKIYNTNTTADFVVAWKGTITETLTNIATPDTLALQERTVIDGVTNLSKLTPIKPEWDTVNDLPKTTPVGESLMLFPAETYDLAIYLSQTPRVGGQKNKFVHKETIKVPALLTGETLPFEAGKQYNITFTVYGLEQIQLEVELTPWKQGADITVDNDEME